MKSEDTQWPRYEVFLQEREGLPHEHVGGVHAPDIEMALLNARDVFARRPTCLSMWVVPTSGILSKTRQELESWQTPRKVRPVEVITFLVFCKHKPAGSHVYVGEIEAGSIEAALSAALEKYRSTPEPYTWWLFQDSSVLKSAPEDVEAMFDPALDKPYRQSSYYKVISAMRRFIREADNGS